VDFESDAIEVAFIRTGSTTLNHSGGHRPWATYFNGAKDMKKTALIVALSMMLAGPALAGECPILMTNIDEAMKTATVDDATKLKITELAAKGKAEHEAGDHAASVATLNEALALIAM
jgi:hypothetical protein